MATQIAAADGNLTTAGTWGAVDATSLLDSEAANTVLTTSYVSSSAFTPGAILVDGVAVKIATRAAVPTGTMSVRLFNSTAAAAVAGTEVTINVSDIVVATLAENGWLFFKFGAPVLLLVLTNYTVQATTSNATQVNLYRDGTANNWARMLRTTTTGAPGAGDNFFVLGEWTAAATKANRAVTMDSTAATDYGGASTTLASIGISNGGTITWGATAATTYILRVSGILRVWQGGIYQQGTTGTKIPVDSIARLEFDCAADGDFGLDVSGTMVGQGNPRTAATDVYFALLNTDEAAAQTVLGVDRVTGWKSGDEIVIASTTTVGLSEERVLNGDAGASSVTVTVGLTNAHSGTAPTQGEVALLTRNVVVRSVSTTAMAYVRLRPVAIIDCDWVEFRYLGQNVAGKQAVTIETTTGSVNLKYCTIRNTETQAIVVTGTTVNNITIDSCVITAAGGGTAVITNESPTTGTALTITGCIIIDTVNKTHTINLTDAGWTLTNNRLVANAATAVIQIAEAGVALTGTVSGNIVHSSSGSAAFTLAGIKGGTIASTTIWRQASADGLNFNNACADIILDGLTIFGCASDNIAISAGATRLTFRNGTFAGDTTSASSSGCNLGSSNTGVFRFENCTFGVASGILAAHTGSDITLGAGGSSASSFELTLVNCILASATEIQNKTGLVARGRIKHQRVDGVTNVHKTEYPGLGTIEYEATIFRTAAPSEKMTPTAAPVTLRLQSSRKRIPVASGKAITVGVYVRKSAAYAGSAPRLIMAANPALGIDNDIVLDSLTVAADTWEQLTGTQTPVAEEDGVVECYVDCDGSAGIVYLDDWSATTS